MGPNRVSVVAAAIAHLLAWAAVLYAVFAASYVVESVEATLPGEAPADPVQTTASFLEANGVYGLVVALAPALLTALALLGAVAVRDRTAVRMVLLWVPVVTVVAFCLGAIFTIGVLYVPAAVALIVAALADLARRPDEA